MALVGLNLNEQNAVFSTVAAVLHLGNISFEPASETDSSQVVESTSSFHVEAAAQLLGCSPVALAKALTTRTRVTPDGGSLLDSTWEGKRVGMGSWHILRCPGLHANGPQCQIDDH